MSRTSLSALLAVIASALVHAPVGEAQVWEVGNVLLELATPQAYAYYGLAMAAGDFDGDGVTDLAVGAPYWNSSSTSDAGRVRVYAGNVTRGFSTIGILAGSGASDSELGEALAAGDFDGNGHDELAIGLPAFDAGGTIDSGAVAIADYDGSSWSTWMFSQDDTPWSPPEPGDRFGETLEVGDFNGDGYDDLAVGSPYENFFTGVETGCVQIYYGSGSGLSTTDSQGFAAGMNGVLGVGTTTDHMGWSLAAGDFDGDGYDDLAIGAPHRDVLGLDDAGQVHILYGSSTGIVTDGQQLLSDDLGGIVLAAHDYFGAALASYNFNEAPWYCVLYPCYEDLAIGIPGQQLAGHQNVGCVKVTYGGPDGIQTIGFDYLDANSANAAPEEGDRFGQKLAAGHSTAPASTTHGDLAVATPYEDYYLTNDGFVHLFFGSNLGVDMDHQEQPLGQYPGFEVAPPEANDYFGTTMVFGDFDGDGHGDLAIGVPYKDSGALDDSGCVQVLYGALFAGGFECGGTSNWTVTRPGRDGNPRRHGACSPASEESLPVDQPGGAGTEEPESRRSGLRRVGG